jgi:hypothetical protein
MVAFSLLGLAAWTAVFGPATATAAATAPPRECRAEVVRPEHSERSARFVAWLKAHPDEAPSGYTFQDLFPEPGSVGGGSPCGLRCSDPAKVFIADVDNDGKDEYLVTTTGGSAGYLVLTVFRAEVEGWTRMEAPQELVHATHPFFDLLANEESLVVRFCGSTYVTLEGGVDVYDWRKAYLWQDGAARPVCDAAWLAEQRRFFQQLFDHRLFDAAYGFLNGAQAACQPPPDRSLWLWMESDLALAAYSMGTYRSCLRHVAAARQSPGFGSAAPALRQALAANDSRCGHALSQAAAARYDYSWLRKFRGSRDQQFAPDRQGKGLLSAAVPDLEFEGGAAFRDVLAARLGVPQGIEFYSDRYFVLAGCMPHSCDEKGVIWVDLAAQRSIVLIEATLYDKSAYTEPPLKHVVALGSTTIEASDVPQQFWEQVAKVRPGTAVLYAGPDGRWQTIKVPGWVKTSP